MILKRGTKPEEIFISMDVKHKIMSIGDYIEIEIDDPVEIAKLRAKGFTNL